MRATPNPAGNPWLALVLIVVAGSWAIALAFSGPAQARFQSPVSPLSVLPTATAPVSPPPPATAVPPPTFAPAGPTPGPSLRPLPTAAPLPFPSPTATRPLPELLTATAVAARFLPAPTLSSPNAAPAGGSPAGAVAPLSAPLVTPIRPTATPAPAGFDPGRLIGTGLTALGYMWLACGSVAVLALLGVAAWLIRRRV